MKPKTKEKLLEGILKTGLLFLDVSLLRGLLIKKM